eukprot:gene9861-biopygen2520
MTDDNDPYLEGNYELASSQWIPLFASRCFASEPGQAGPPSADAPPLPPPSAAATAVPKGKKHACGVNTNDACPAAGGAGAGGGGSGRSPPATAAKRRAHAVAAGACAKPASNERGITAGECTEARTNMDVGSASNERNMNVGSPHAISQKHLQTM